MHYNCHDESDACVYCRAELHRYAPLNPYKQGLAAMRAAAAAPASVEERWKAERQREIDATRAALDATVLTPRLTAAEAENLARFKAPDPYRAGIAALLAKEANR